MDVWDPDEECWEYLDPKSAKQGPFSANRMAVWYEHHMLPEDLGVRHGTYMPFIPIKELFHPPLQPFRSRPRPGTVQAAIAKCNCQWQYCDTKGALQGPFTSAQMALWFEHNMLPPSLQLRRTTDTQFATIPEYFPKPAVPFQSLPTNPAAAGGGVKEAANNAAAAAIASSIGIKPGGQQAIPKQQPKAQQAPAPTQPAAKQPAAAPKQKAKVKAAAKQEANVKSGYAETDTNGKATGKGKNVEGPIGGAASNSRGKAKAKAQQQQDDQWQKGGWSWNENGNDKWWEKDWSSWNGWSADGSGGGADWQAAKGDSNGATPPKEKGDKGATAVQAAFGSLRWGPHAEETDLFPEDSVRRVLDEGIVWEERWISPLTVRFSQGKIHPFFHERGPISEVMLQIRIQKTEENDEEETWKRIDPPFPPIRLLHLKAQGVLVTLDNRRLYALQRFALQEWPAVCLTKALVVDELTPTRLRSENRKFTNRLCGLQLEIESRSNAFDSFSWVTEAAHAEAVNFIRPVSMRAADKMFSILPMLVVHTLLSRKNRPFLRSRWPILHHAAITLRSPQKREFPSKRLLMHHVFDLGKPTRNECAAPSVCIGFKAETVVSLSKGKSSIVQKHTITRPLALKKACQAVSDTQRRVLRAMLPMFCLPYARSALRGTTREWVVAFLLAWGKVAAASLELPEPLSAG